MRILCFFLGGMVSRDLSQNFEEEIVFLVRVNDLICSKECVC